MKRDREARLLRWALSVGGLLGIGMGALMHVGPFAGLGVLLAGLLAYVLMIVVFEGRCD